PSVERQAEALHLIEEGGLHRSLSIQPDDSITADVRIDLEIQFATDAGAVQAVGIAQGVQFFDQGRDLGRVEHLRAV
ncbi:hypothetical protein, partial [Klebsiella pneumoniae]|uniref:hypothetical protein n=1 Tax=Klebsiella pneumoniae TaxID=573 RepID=UPI00272FDC09